MAHNRVEGELYHDLTGQLFEIGRQMRQKNGYPYDPLALKNHLQDGVEGKFQSTYRECLNRGWRVFTDITEPAVRDFNGLEIIPIPGERRGAIRWQDVVDIAKKEGGYHGQRRADFLFFNQKLIPEAFVGSILIFPATIWFEPDSEVGVSLFPFLSYKNNYWCMAFWPIGTYFDEKCKLVRFL